MNGGQKLKGVLMDGEPDAKVCLETSVRIPGHDDIKKASIPIAFVAANIVQESQCSIFWGAPTFFFFVLSRPSKRREGREYWSTTMS
jgi:hypothetical protein